MKMKKLLIVFILMSLLILTSCSSDKVEQSENLNREQEENIAQNLRGSLDIPEDYDIKQFEGLSLNFIVEKNINANILSHESELFSEITGINIKIRAMDYDSLVQNANLDLLSQSGEYQIIYVDQY